MTQVFDIGRQKFYALAEYMVTGLVLIFGFRYLKQIIEVVMTELYKIFIQGGRVAF